MIDSKKLKFVDGSTFEECYSYWNNEMSKAKAANDIEKQTMISNTINDFIAWEKEAKKKAESKNVKNKIKKTLGFIVNATISLVTLDFMGFSGKKLTGGIFRVTAVCLFHTYLGEEGRVHFKRNIVTYLSDNPDSPGINLLASLIGVVVAIWTFVWFVKGVYMIYSFQHDLPAFAKWTEEQKKYATNITSDKSNIKSAYAYRDAKMSTMTPDKAAEFFMETNSLINSKASDSVLGYINSKMTMMTPEAKLDFLRGKKK